MTSPATPHVGEPVLAPCPFCGGPAHSTPDLGELAALVMCSENDCCTVDGPTLQDAIAAWNRRAHPAPSPAPVGSDEFTEREAIANQLRGSLSREDSEGVIAMGADFVRRIFAAITTPAPEAPDAALRARLERAESALREAGAFVHEHYAPAVDSEHRLMQRIRAALTEEPSS